MRVYRNSIHTLPTPPLLLIWAIVATPNPVLLIFSIIGCTVACGVVLADIIGHKRSPSRSTTYRKMSIRILETMEIAFISGCLPMLLGSHSVVSAVPPAVFLGIRYSRGTQSPLLDIGFLLFGSLLLPFFIPAVAPFPPLFTILFLSGLAGFLVKYSKMIGIWLHMVKKPNETMSREAYDKMLATLAHEIRTPLTIMQTTENVLMEQIPGPLNNRQKKFMESIYINTQRLIAFSENMLTLLKLGQDWQPDLSKTIDLRILTRQVVEMVQPMIQLRKQKIKYSFPSMVSHPNADEPWIRQVLVNLIHNASKHTEEEGTIVISLTQDDEQVVLTVSDNGQGLLGEGRETLFKEFYQEDHDLKTYQDGFGLGLAIVRAIIEKHHGHVYITSSKNLGTMVSFNLPAEAME